MTHQHAHGYHTHTHDHVRGGAPHTHGWHSPPATCTGDSTFGDEADACEPSRDFIRGQLAYDPQVVVPFVPGMLHEEAAQLGRPVDVSRSEWDYWELLRQLWEGGRTFVVVEQDMAPTDEQVQALFDCPEPWCAHDYAGRYGMGLTINPVPTLGAVKFGAELIAAQPDLLDDIGQTTWSQLDIDLGRALLDRGVSFHVHEPSVTHLHDYER